MKGILEWEDLSGYDYYLAVFTFFSFLLIWQFVGYPSLMVIVALKSKPKNKDYSFLPFVAFNVLTYNEGKVIKKRILRDNHLLDIAAKKERKSGESSE